MAGKVKNADGSWSKFSGMKNPSFAEVTGNPNDNTNLKNALDAKQADIMSTISGAGGQYLRRKSDNTGLEFVTGGGGGGGVADVKVDGASVVTSGVAEIDLTEKLDKLPKPTLPGSGGHYNFPYNAEFTADGSKIDIQIETMSLDGDEAQQSFTKTVPAATTTTAGLMTAADKVKLDNSASASDLSTHTSNTDIHVTATEKLTWANKQAPLTISQMRAVNSGITDAKVLDYDNHKSNTAIHVTADEKSAWDGKSKVSVSASGTSTNVVSFIKVNDVEYKLPSSGGGGTITDVQVDGTSCVAGTVANITGKYSKPTTGIPKSDLADAVSESLDRADSAVQEVETGENNGTIKVDGDEVAVKGLGSAAYTASTAYATSSQGSKADTAYQKPASGIPKSDLADDVKTSLGKADTALQTHQDISGKADVSALTSHTGDTGVHVSSTEKGTWNGKYSKPTDGIPKSDLADDVKTSLGKADTALQSHQTIATGGANGTIAVGGTDVAVKGLGSAAYTASTDYATSTQGSKADTAYQKPASGIPASDLADAYGDSKNPYGSKTAKYVLAAPSAGGAPSFRALKAEDISDMEFITQAEALAILNS